MSEKQNSLADGAGGIHLSLWKSCDSIERDVSNILAHSTAVAALNAAHARGRNQRKFAGKLAVDAMREVLAAELPIRSEVVIGEGGRDRAPLLPIGEKLGPGEDVLMKLAVDPLEGTNLCARGEPGAITVIAGALVGEGEFLSGIEGYFDKIILGKDLGEKIRARKRQRLPQIGICVDEDTALLDNPIEDIIEWIAHERRKSVTDVVAMVLERDRNEAIIDRLRALNVQVLLIKDGDVTAGLLALDPQRDVDVALGIGSAPEGVITAAICRVFQGYMEARWWLDDPRRGADHRAQLAEKKIDSDYIYTQDDLAKGHVMFALTGVTYNQYTPGVQYLPGGSAITHTIYGRSRSGTVYERRAIHQNPPAQPQYPREDLP